MLPQSASRDLLNIVHDIHQAAITFRSLAEPWAGELAEFLLTILGAAAKLERATILVRTAEGRARAETRGQEPWPMPKSAQLAEARAMHLSGRGMREMGGVFGCSASTVSRSLRRNVRGESATYS